MKRFEYNIQTGEKIEIDLTDAEIAAIETAKTEKAKELQKIQEIKDDRVSAINKIVTAASLTDAEKKALFGE